MNVEKEPSVDVPATENDFQREPFVDVEPAKDKERSVDVRATKDDETENFVQDPSLEEAFGEDYQR